MTLPFNIILFLVLPNAIEMHKSDCPTIIKRQEWGARDTNLTLLSILPPTHVVIHHSATKGCTNQTDCKTLVKSFQDFHINERKWNDIGYNFLVGEDGNVYEGRGWDIFGAHAPKLNSKSIGICIIGTFTTSLPSTKALEAVQHLIKCGVSKEKIIKNYELVGHRQVRDTECPGDTFYNEITSWPHWSSVP